MVRTSVIVPLFNASSSAERALRSVLDQSDPDLELIAVNDGSSDDTLTILHRLLDPRLRVISHDVNRGISAARNTGLASAAGEFVAFLDSDDFWEPNFLLRMHDARRDADAVICGRTVVLPDRSERVEHSQRLGAMTGDVAASRMMIGEITPFPWDKVIRRSAFARVRYPEDVHRFEDQVVGVIALSRLRSVVSIAEPLVRYHVAAGSLTWGRTPRISEAEKALRYLETSLGEWLNDSRRSRAFLACSTIFMMLTAQSAMRSADVDAARGVVAGCRRRISLKMLASTLWCRPLFGAGAMLLKVFPALYRAVFTAYVKRQYSLN